MELIVKHSCIIIEDYELGDCPTLEGLFSVWDKVRYCSEIKILHYDELNKRMYIPRGVDIAYICNLLGINKPNMDYKHNEYDSHEDIMINYLPRDEVQKEALRFMVGKGEYSDNRTKSQLSLNLGTGKGKTYCSIANTSIQKGIKSAIIASSLDWLNQWKKCILEYTNTNPSEIYMMSGSSTVNRMFKSDPSQYKFILISHDTIRSYGDKFGWDKITELFEHMRIGIKYYDEAHLYFSNIAMIDYYTNVYKTYYVTATPQRSDEEENRIFSYYFRTVPSINLFNEDEDPRTHYIAIKYDSKPNPMDVSKCKNQYGFDKNKYCDYIVKQDNYYKILHIVLNMAMKKNKTVIYIAKNSSIDITYHWIINTYPELEPHLGIFNSTIDKDIKKRELEKKIILSTTKSLGTAQDIKGLDMVVVLAEPFGSKVLAKQTLGRTRDYDTVYVDIVDVGFPAIRRYLKDKEPVFTKHAKSASVIKIDQKELDSRVNKILQERQDRINAMIIPVKIRAICPVSIK